VTVNAKPLDCQFDMSAKDEHLYRRVVMPFTVEVLPMKLPRADIAFGMYFRALESLVLPPDFLTPEMMMAYYRDMARHGHTSVYLALYQRLHADDGSLVISGVPGHPGQAHDVPGYSGLDIPIVKKMKMMLDAGLVSPKIPIMLDSGTGLLNREQATRFASDTKREFRKRQWPEPLWYGPDEPDQGYRAAVFRKTFDNFSAYRTSLRRDRCNQRRVDSATESLRGANEIR